MKFVKIKVNYTHTTIEERINFAHVIKYYESEGKTYIKLIGYTNVTEVDETIEYLDKIFGLED